jgi:hypothetical protein
VGHLVAGQQTICYIRCGKEISISTEFFNTFKPGTKPERFFQSDEEDEIKKMLFTSLDILERDYQQNVFDSYSPWVTKTGIDINNINEALVYLHHHEGVHTGVISSIKKLVQK